MKKTYNILEMLQNIMGAKLEHLVEPGKGYRSYTGTFSVTNVSRWLLSTSKRSLERFYGSPQDWTGHIWDTGSKFFKPLCGCGKRFQQPMAFNG